MAAPPPSQYQAIPTVGKKAEHDRTRAHPPPQEKYSLKATSCLASGQPGFSTTISPLIKRRHPTTLSAQWEGGAHPEVLRHTWAKAFWKRRLREASWSMFGDLMSLFP